MKAKTGIGIKVDIDIHILPEDGETMDALVERIRASGAYDILSIGSDRVLVHTTQERN